MNEVQSILFNFDDLSYWFFFTNFYIQTTFYLMDYYITLSALIFTYLKPVIYKKYICMKIYLHR